MKKSWRTAEVERISALAGVSTDGAILPPDTSGGIDRSSVVWWSSQAYVEPLKDKQEN